jgi:hypothetical protein
MTTVKQIERLWKAQAYGQLVKELLSSRPERSTRLEVELASPLPAAALTIIRLDELSQPHVPLYGKLLRRILATQEADGGWADPLTTAICLRALLAGRGQGHAIDRGIFSLASLQKSDGIWPNVPFRRLPADPFVSAFILLQLGDRPQFRAAVRFFDAINWFETHEAELDPEARRLWDRASARCQLLRPQAALAALWS